MVADKVAEVVRMMIGLVPIGRLTASLRRDQDASEHRRHRAIDARIASEQAVAEARSSAAHTIALSRRSERVLASYRRAEQVQREAHH